MKSRIISSMILAVLLIAPLSISPPSDSHAQDDEADPNLTYICFQTLEDIYLIGFTNINESRLGFLPSENGTITIYSPVGAYVYTALYHILPDAQSGGYRRDGRIATAFTDPRLPTSDRPCTAQYPGIISDESNRTVSMPISRHQALLMTVDFQDPNFDVETYTAELEEMDDGEFRGVVGVQFFPRENDASIVDSSFQFIQLTDGAIDLTFPFLNASPDEKDFVLIANKGVSVSISTVDDPYPDGLVPGRGDIQYEQLDDRIAVFDTSLELAMRDAGFRIYPESGIIETYYNDFIRIHVNDSVAKRGEDTVEETRYFAIGQTIQTLRLPGINAHYYRPDDLRREEGSVGSLKLSGDDSSIEILDITSQGQLIVGPVTVGGGVLDEVMVEAWFVEDYP